MGAQRHAVHLVQKQCAPVGQLEQAGPALLSGAGEGPGLIAEELALQQALGESGAVHRHKGAVPPGAGIVNGLGKELLSGAALPVDHHRVVAFGTVLRPLDQAAHGVLPGEDVIKVVFGGQAPLAQLEPEVFLQLLDLGHVPQGE